MIALSNVITFNEKVPIMDEIKGLLFQNGENQILWFIAALYVYSIIFYWIERWCKTDVVLFVTCLILFVMNILYSYWLKGSDIPWHVDSFGCACFYMALGKLYKHREMDIDKRFGFSSVSITGLFYAAAITLLGKSCSYNGSPYLVDSLCLTLTGLIVIISISKKYLQNNKFVLFVGANTLFYFTFHGKGYSLLQTITEKVMVIGNIQHNIILDDVLGFVIVFLDALLLIIPTMLVNQYAPYFLGKGFRLWKTE